MEGGIADYQVIGEAEVLLYDFDVLESDAPDAEELRAWITDVEDGRAKWGRTPAGRGRTFADYTGEKLDRARRMLAEVEARQ